MPPSDPGQRMPLIECHAASRPYAGAAVSGDLEVVTYFPGGALAAVIDGLGHGPEAAHAASVAAAVLRRQPAEPVTDLMVLCHEALRPTRGAVMSLASFDGEFRHGHLAGRWKRHGGIAAPRAAGLTGA